MAAVLTADNLIKLENLPTVFADISSDPAASVVPQRSFKAECAPQVMKIEKALLEKYLLEANGNVSRAAQLANIPRRTFYRILDRHELKGRKAAAE